ncbi:hypothetical protein CH75_10385 [Dyella jiangningensis]|nr:hypothetical protein CH75_10385 [Dyella jiangningensis]
MNAERLNAIAQAILNDFSKNEISAYLRRLKSDLANMISQPASPQFQEQLSQVRHLLTEALTQHSEIDHFSATWQQVLEEIGGKWLTGSNLDYQIEEIFSRNQMTPAVASKELNSLVDDVAAFIEALEKITSAFEHLNIGSEELDPGECEIGVLIPRGFVHNKLANFGKELTELNKILGVFSELVTGNRPGFKIRTISSSDLSVFLESAPPVCAAVAVALERIVELYKKLLEIKKIKADLKAVGIKQEVLQGVENHADGVMDSGIDELAKELEERFSAQLEQGRANEISIELRQSLKKIAGRIDRGFNIDIRMSAPSIKAGEPVEHAVDLTSFNEIAAASENMKFVSQNGEPILKLPDGDIGAPPNPEG